MLPFSDEPYRYFPPRPNRLAGWALKALNRWWRLPRVWRIGEVAVSGGEALREGLRRGDRVMLVVNHSTHADAAILIEALRQVGMSGSFMAAYDVFLRGRFGAWAMQKLGCFSVDREGSDQQAMRQAVATLSEGRRALVIFPEGNVYLTNDQVTPFHEGAAMVAFRAAKQVEASGGRVVVAPVAMKMTYVQDVRPVVAERLRSCAQTLGCAWEAKWTPLEALRQVGLSGLRRNLKNRGVDVPQGEALPEVIEAAGDQVLRQLEKKLGIEAKAGEELVERVRRARRMIHEVRIDPQRIADHAAAATWADEAMLAYQIASYSGKYVAEKSTVDRVAETAEKLAEDLYRKAMAPMGWRRAMVRFGEVMVVDAGDRTKKLREAVGALTGRCEAAVAVGLDALNAENASVGGQMWDQAIGDGSLSAAMVH